MPAQRSDAELARLREHLLPAELAMLDRPEVQAMTPGERVAFFRANRRAGVVVTLFAGGVRLLLLGLGAIAMVAFGIDQAREGGVSWASFALVSGGVALFGWTLWMTRAMWLNVRAMRRPLAD